ncbi:aspartate/glutamate racemase family protein [Tranquillimonas rosea]|uniref:aspartate/glutamate racemase family protein n=1 Tax=Tranquillimonas rosea TaxID=641238 RepID=UPI003BA85790
MRLHVVNPNTSASMTRTIAAAAHATAPPDVEIVATTSPRGPASIEGHHDGAMAVPGLLQRITEAEADGVDAHIIACFDDTGLHAARCAATRPVVGIGEAACLLACQLAERFIVVTAAPVSVPVLEANLRLNGLATRCAGVRAAGVAVLDLAHATGETDPVAAALRQAARDVPDAALVLGCGGMAEMAERLSHDLDRPVIDGVAAAVQLASGLARLGHRTVKTGGYAAPRNKETQA